MATTAERSDDDLRPEYDLGQLRPVPGGYRRRRAGAAEPPAGPPGAGGESSTKLNPAETRAFIERMDAALLPLFTTCVVPLYGDHGGVPIQRGSGTLFRVADHSFLVSACHVTDLARSGTQLYISDARPGSTVIPVEGAPHCEKHLDISVWELAPHVVAALPNRTFLTVHQVDRADLRVARGWYYVHGYPNCWSDPKPEERKTAAKAFTYGAVPYEGDTGAFAGYDPRLHVLLTAPRDGNVDSHGAETAMPASLRGVCGGGIWQAYYEGLPSRSWTVDDAVVVAVQTGVYREGAVVRGTRWWVIGQILSRKYPELEGPLALLSPSAWK